MKKIMRLFLLVMIIAMIVVTSAFAGNIYTEYSYAASGSTLATVTLDDQSTKGRYKIYSIYGDSDLSSAVLTVYKADAAGVTTSYTAVYTMPQTNTSTYTYKYDNGGEPIFVGDINYRYKITMSSTTANSLIVNYNKE